MVSEKCRIDTELLPSLFLRCTTDPLRREKYPAVTHLKFLTRENSEQVTGTTGRTNHQGCVSVMSCRERLQDR